MEPECVRYVTKDGLRFFDHYHLQKTVCACCTGFSSTLTTGRSLEIPSIIRLSAQKPPKPSSDGVAISTIPLVASSLRFIFFPFIFFFACPSPCPRGNLQSSKEAELRASDDSHRQGRAVEKNSIGEDRHAVSTCEIKQLNLKKAPLANMNFTTVAVLAFIIVLAQASPARVRRDSASDRYCVKHMEHYNKYCGENAGPIDRALFGKVAKFCPAYEKHCAVGKAGLVELPDLGSPLVMPPVLPRGSDFASLDLPIADERKPIQHNAPRTVPQTTRLTAAIVATCTPECTAPHCTDECKCAHTHPKVHQMCNPPSSASMAQTCQRWYSKCTMFAPVQY
ncbi:hypothetical protein L3Y34_010691 [Caenorhabditis briggsae]|uniref:Protein CBR-OSM-11 n=3 Tax=Caenorhabditis briggsae TaxID=6238 RepID=A0AAE8ZP86_CAEBR|nr:hypothetical protein L3Y34_010691 [Caenorhabditis briggsae]